MNFMIAYIGKRVPSSKGSSAGVFIPCFPNLEGNFALVGQSTPELLQKIFLAQGFPRFPLAVVPGKVFSGISSGVPSHIFHPGALPGNPPEVPSGASYCKLKLP